MSKNYERIASEIRMTLNSKQRPPEEVDLSNPPTCFGKYEQGSFCTYKCRYSINCENDTKTKTDNQKEL